MATLRFLNDSGIATFEAYLLALDNEPQLPPPVTLLTSDSGSGALGEAIEIDQRVFPTKLAMARYVADTCADLVQESNPVSRGIWSWLSLFWLDQLLVPDPASGDRKPNKVWYYVPQSSHFVEYRHLLLGPYRTYRSYGTDARLLLMHPLSVWSDVEEQLAGKREFLRLRGALAAADALYFDSRRDRPKRRVAHRKRDDFHRHIPP